MIDVNFNISLSGKMLPSDHEVSGEVLILNGEKTILRFVNFSTVNGPNLHVYLSSDLNDDTDFIDLGKLKANEGNFNYEIDENIDLKKYNKVLIWCVPFSVLFSYAELS